MVILLDGALAMFTALIVVGGVIIGIFTATEAAAFAVIYAFIVTFLIYREAPLVRFVKILYSSLKTLAIVMSLIAAASAFGYLLARLQVPRLATEFLLSITDNYYVLLFMVNIMLLILGCIMDMAPLILICTPILFPVLVLKMGMDPVHFGIMLLLNLSIGLCTPPVGSALFVGSAVGKISIERASKGCIPFYISMLDHAHARHLYPVDYHVPSELADACKIRTRRAWPRGGEKDKKGKEPERTLAFLLSLSD